MPNTALADSIPQLQAQLEEFRATHPGRTKLPESLWRSAVKLARRHGVYVVAHPLRLDYSKLKRQANGASAPRRRKAQARFVELMGAAPARVDEYLIEFESPRGPKMRIHWNASGPLDWGALLRAWRRVQR
jgi:hypothetical protein